MNRIYKYELNEKIEMPKGARVLDVQIDLKTGIPCIWAVVDTENELETRLFHIYLTGDEICKVGRYIGTYQFHQGQHIGHVYENVQD